MVVETRTQKNIEKYEVEKPDSLELIIKPNERLITWLQAQSKKEQDTEMEMLECPHCQTPMKKLKNINHIIWHHCTECQLTFSDRQHKYFTRMIMRLIENK